MLWPALTLEPRATNSRSSSRDAIDRTCPATNAPDVRVATGASVPTPGSQASGSPGREHTPVPRRFVVILTHNRKEHLMATIHFTLTTTATPEQFVAGVTDFGPGRSKLFGRSDDEYLQVHDQGPDWADVTEGSGGVWERLRYDWSDPNRIVLTTTDSNVWGRGSGHTYTLTARPEGTTEIDVVVVRDGKNIKGRLLGALLGLIGQRALGGALAKTTRVIEDRHVGSPPFAVRA